MVVALKHCKPNIESGNCDDEDPEPAVLWPVHARRSAKYALERRTELCCEPGTHRNVRVTQDHSQPLRKGTLIQPSNWCAALPAALQKTTVCRLELTLTSEVRNRGRANHGSVLLLQTG
ncbi:hypothetical protein NDU88_003480 [Pleurodeles waltl]|uniref:Uncharacterized protein n=1 Tax=Pleurodeles waltl TaxID=8319 RepID=A0AAV7LJ00_PLEWA|nr:hypothetical protein NDU88_003480 [Pleurodeles waltl]